MDCAHIAAGKKSVFIIKTFFQVEFFLYNAILQKSFFNR